MTLAASIQSIPPRTAENHAVEGASATKKSPISQILKEKIQRVWHAFVELITKILQALRCLPRPSPTTIACNKIQQEIVRIGAAKKAFDDISSPPPTTVKATSEAYARSLAKKKDWIESHETAITQAMKALQAAKINPAKLPKKVALQLSDILTSYGVALYNNTEVAADPFRTAFEVLKLAFIMQQYALGLREAAPNLATDERKVRDKAVEYAKEANDAIAELNKDQWAKAISSLDLRQLTQCVTILRYLNGCMRYLKIEDLAITGRLLGTAEACLMEARKNPRLPLVEVNDILAELKYNEISGFLANQAKALEQAGKHDEAEAMRKLLSNLWDEAISLSKDPLIRARCYNKRSFAEKLTPQEVLDFRNKSVVVHKALSKDKQNPALLAITLNNLAHAYMDMGDVEANFEQAFKHSSEAYGIVIDQMAKGKTDTQFDNIVSTYFELSQKKIEQFTQRHERLRVTLEAAAARDPEGVAARLAPLMPGVEGKVAVMNKKLETALARA